MFTYRFKHFSLEQGLRASIAALLFLLPWQTMWITREPMLNGAKWEYGTLGLYGTEILFWIVAVLFVVWFLRKWKLEIGNWKLGWTKDRIFLLAVLSCIMYHVSSILWSIDKELALQQTVRIIEAFLLFTILFVGPLSFASSARWFIGGAVVQSILGVWQFAAQSTFASQWLGLAYHSVALGGTSVVEGITTGRWLRAYGAFPHPNVLGGYLIVAIVVMFLLYAREKYRNKLSFIIYHLSFIILLTGLFFTFSRSAWIAAIIVLLLWAWNKRYLTPLIIFIAVFGVLSASFFPLVKTRFVGESIYEIKSTTERISGYTEAWGLFKQHPWRGVGAGNYTVALQTRNPNQPGYVYQPVHNIGVLAIVELGVIGMVLLFAVVISFITYHISHITYQKAGNAWYVLCGMCYVLLALFDHYLLSLYIGLMLSAVLWGAGSRFVHELSTE